MGKIKIDNPWEAFLCIKYLFIVTFISNKTSNKKVLSVIADSTFDMMTSEQR